MAIKFPISLAGKRGGGFSLGIPTNYWDLDDLAHTNSIDTNRNMVDVGGVNVIESNTAPDGGGCTVTSNTTHLAKTIVGTAPMSVSVWVQFVVAPSRYNPFLSWRNTQVNGEVMQLGRLSSSAYFGATIHNEAGVETGTQTTTDGWVHYYLSYDGTNFRVYRDGVLKTNNSSYSCSVCTRSRPLRLGRNYGTYHPPCKFAMMGHWEAAPADEAEAQATADYLYNGGVGRRFADL